MIVGRRGPEGGKIHRPKQFGDWDLVRKSTRKIGISARKKQNEINLKIIGGLNSNQVERKHKLPFKIDSGGAKSKISVGSVYFLNKKL